MGRRVRLLQRLSSERAPSSSERAVADILPRSLASFRARPHVTASAGIWLHAFLFDPAPGQSLDKVAGIIRLSTCHTVGDAFQDSLCFLTSLQFCFVSNSTKGALQQCRIEGRVCQPAIAWRGPDAFVRTSVLFRIAKHCSWRCFCAFELRCRKQAMWLQRVQLRTGADSCPNIVI